MALNISKFLDQFFMEAKEKLADIQNQMVELENNPRDKDAIQAIQRGMHTIKGGSRMVGLTGVSDIAHLMEEAFLKLQENDEVPADVMTVLYRGVDGVAERLQAAEEKKELPDPGALQEQLRAVIAGKRPAGGERTANEAPAEAPAADEEPGRRSFKLDFNILKKKFAGKIPSARKTTETDGEPRRRRRTKRRSRPPTRKKRRTPPKKEPPQRNRRRKKNRPKIRENRPPSRPRPRPRPRPRNRRDATRP